MSKKFTAFEEANDRNGILVKKHGKIPSYGLWRETDIGTIEERLDWWKSINFQDGTVNLWINYLVSLKNTSPPLTEFCSKRMGNEFYCDI